MINDLVLLLLMTAVIVMEIMNILRIISELVLLLLTTTVTVMKIIIYLKL